MATTTPDRPEPVEQSLERAVEASRELAADAIRLARLELSEALRNALAGAALLGASALFFTFAWIAGGVALALFLARRTDPVTAVAVLALAHVGLGLACALFARHRAAGAEGRS
jgi:predicted nicotinamide N-methyase